MEVKFIYLICLLKLAPAVYNRFYEKKSLLLNALINLTKASMQIITQRSNLLKLWLCYTGTLLVLTSCTTSKTPLMGAYQLHPLINYYRLSGRLIINTPQRDYYSHFSWQHAPNQDKLELSSPLGMTLAQIVIDHNKFTLRSQDKIYQGNSLDELFISQLGFKLPLANLHYWVQGMPMANIPWHSTAHGFTQLGWQINYLSWYNANQPQVLQVSQENLTIKLVLKWLNPNQDINIQ